MLKKSVEYDSESIYEYVYSLQDKDEQGLRYSASEICFIHGPYMDCTESIPCQDHLLLGDRICELFALCWQPSQGFARVMGSVSRV